MDRRLRLHGRLRLAEAVGANSDPLLPPLSFLASAHVPFFLSATNRHYHHPCIASMSSRSSRLWAARLGCALERSFRDPPLERLTSRAIFLLPLSGRHIGSLHRGEFTSTPYKECTATRATRFFLAIRWRLAAGCRVVRERQISKLI